MKHFTLYLQEPKTKELGLGDLALDRDAARFFVDIDQPNGQMLAQLERPVCIHANSQGLMFSGLELKGEE